ncbi:MAG: hypothetical protein FWF82_04750, partial [Oscillospiraceae bacterium]|nr:hypothetical protein [Oscillospiraceae bacterium]
MKKILFVLLTAAMSVVLATTVSATSVTSATVTSSPTRSCDIGDALEILRCLAKLPSLYDTLDDKPTIEDALCVLKVLAKVEVSEDWRWTRPQSAAVTTTAEVTTTATATTTAEVTTTATATTSAEVTTTATATTTSEVTTTATTTTAEEAPNGEIDFKVVSHDSINVGNRSLIDTVHIVRSLNELYDFVESREADCVCHYPSNHKGESCTSLTYDAIRKIEIDESLFEDKVLIVAYICTSVDSQCAVINSLTKNGKSLSVKPTIGQCNSMFPAYDILWRIILAVDRADLNGA